MPSINYTNMTPAQAHFAGRLNDLLEYEKTRNGRGDYELAISARPGEHLDLNVTGPAFQYAPIGQWLEHPIWEAVRLEDEEVWRVWPPRETIERAGYDFETGQVSRPGIDLPAEPVPVAVMEVPEGWTETAVHVLMECSDLHPETILNQSQTEQVLTALEVDHEDIERLALWLHDVEGETITLRSLIENAEEWAETEDCRHDETHYGREDYAREWLAEHVHLEGWLQDCLDLEQVAEVLLSDMTFSESRNGYVHLYDI